MPMSQAEAASALRDVERTTLRSAELRAYGHASPHLLLWGLIWIAGYAAMGVLPDGNAAMIWLPLDLLGFVGSALIGSRARARASAGAAEAGRAKMATMLAMGLFVGLFIVCVYVVFKPASREPYLVFPAMVLGLVYVVAGVWKMPRLAWIGGVVFVLSMAGFFLMKPYLAFWIAAVGGGGLVLGGLWLRKA